MNPAVALDPMQGIGGDQRAVQVDLAGHHLGHRHLIRLDPGLGLGSNDRGPRGGQMPLVTCRIPGARTVLPSSRTGISPAGSSP
jgi:hypothetical protein